MRLAELLREHANLAMREGGMYYSGEYLGNLATIAESIDAENAKLRELVCDLYEAYEGEVNDCWLVEFRERMRELGIEVDR